MSKIAVEIIAHRHSDFDGYGDGHYSRTHRQHRTQNLELNLCYTLKKSLLCVRLSRHSIRAADVALTARRMSLGRWLLVACFSSITNHNNSGLIFFQVSLHTPKKSLCLPRTVLHEQKNHFAIGRNSERCSYHTDLSRFVLPICDPSALNFSQLFGFQDSPNLSKIEKVAENRDFDGKEILIVKSAIAISKRVLG